MRSHHAISLHGPPKRHVIATHVLQSIRPWHPPPTLLCHPFQELKRKTKSSTATLHVLLIVRWVQNRINNCGLPIKSKFHSANAHAPRKFSHRAAPPLRAEVDSASARARRSHSARKSRQVPTSSIVKPCRHKNQRTLMPITMHKDRAKLSSHARKIRSLFDNLRL